MIPSPTKLALLTGVVLLLGEGSSHPTRYDQRQDGDLNVRADVSDVVLVAVPPKDFISNGVAWFGTNFVRRHPGGNPNRIPFRTASKHGFVPSEKSPYKVDLGKSSVPLTKLQSPVVEEVKLYRIREADQEETENDDGSKILLNSGKSVKKALALTVETSVEPNHMRTPEHSDRRKRTTQKPEGTDGEKSEISKAGESVTPIGSDTKLDEGSGSKAEDIKSEESKTTSTKEDAGAVECDPEGGGHKIERPDRNQEVVVVMNECDPDSIMRWDDCGPDGHRGNDGKCIYENISK